MTLPRPFLIHINNSVAGFQVACTNRNFPQNPQRTQPRPDLLRDMARSHFCLIMPGNAQSSGRLADAFFTGCIPVFLGPPFHSLPFGPLVRIRAPRSCAMLLKLLPMSRALPTSDGPVFFLGLAPV